jgi:hypothetical protein
MARSDVFAAMLNKKDLAEGKSDWMTIVDINPESLKEMIRFLYTDQVPLMAKIVF